MTIKTKRVPRGTYNAASTCSVTGCGNAVSARWLCAMHYARWSKHGDPLVSLAALDPQTYDGETVTGRTCARCKTWKRADEFGRDTRRPDRLHAYCLACKRDDAKARRAANPERARQQQRRRTIERYGLTPEGYDELLADQEHRCAICRSDKPGGNHGHFVIDHDHKTGRVRGLLCKNCNNGIGMLGDSAERLVDAAQYLNRNTEPKEIEL